MIQAYTLNAIPLALVVGCHLFPAPKRPTVEGDCTTACENLTRLECPGHEGSPGPDEIYGTPDDVSCDQACTDIVQADPVVTLNQSCVSGAASCAAADACMAE